MIEMGFIHDAGYVVLTFTIGMLAGYLLKVVMYNYERIKERKR